MPLPDESASITDRQRLLLFLPQLYDACLRLLSGVGEASFVTVVPPLITETAPPGERGVWLALFYTAMPVGAGLGYVYGSVLASSSLG